MGNLINPHIHLVIPPNDVPDIESSSELLSDPATTSHVITKPSGVVNGDLLVCACQMDGTFFPAFHGPDSSWFKFKTHHGTTTGAPNHTQSWFFKYAGGSEPATYTFTTSASKEAVFCMMRISGHNTTWPIDHCAGRVLEGVTGPTQPDLVTTADEVLGLLLSGDETGASNNQTLVPSGATLVDDGESSVGDAAYALAQKDFLTAGSQAGGAWTNASSANYILSTVGILPAAASATERPRIKGQAFSQSGFTSSHTVQGAAGTEENDLIVIVALSAFGGKTATPPSGFTEIIDVNATGSGIYVFWKIAAVGDVCVDEGDVTYSYTSTSDRGCSHTIVIKDGTFDATTPIDVVGTSNTASGTTRTALAITTVTAKALAFAVFTGNTVSILADGNEIPAGWSVMDQTSTSGPDDGALTIAHKYQETAATTGNAASDIDTSEDWLAIQFAIRPV